MKDFSKNLNIDGIDGSGYEQEDYNIIEINNVSGYDAIIFIINIIN